MAIIGLDPDEAIEYIPECERESDDPCIINIKFVSYGKVKKYADMITRKSKGVRDTSKLAEVQAEIQLKQFCDNVESISGFSVKGKEITGPEEFYDLAPATLIYEIIGAMEDSAKLTEGQKKTTE